ncbi:MAG: translation initiation factor IF-2, partial [Flavobacteriales bacterium]|nr:translation initiation factor IF-2 [Flavobacteriales bacterium]
PVELTEEEAPKVEAKETAAPEEKPEPPKKEKKTTTKAEKKPEPEVKPEEETKTEEVVAEKPAEPTPPEPEPEKPAEVVETPEAVKEEPAEPKETKTEEAQAPPKAEEDADDGVIKARVSRLEGPTIVGKIDLPEPQKKPVASSSDSEIDSKGRKRKRKRIGTEPAKKEGAGPRTGGGPGGPGGGGDKRGRKGRAVKEEPNEEEIRAQIKDTLARLSSSGGKSKSSKYRRQKRQAISEQMQQDMERAESESMILKVTEFVSANELAKMMNVPVNEIISAGMALGLFLSINQRLDAETLSIIAEEFGYKMEFVSADLQETLKEEEEIEDDEATLVPRPPIVTVMGHVDHGKTSLLDYVRKANVIAGEAGGITQHIGAYAVDLKDGRRITFLDTPGHEAFTAMRARGAQVTDVAIIVIAADDDIMPQTVEAINHAQAAGVPIIFAINKVDKPNANPDKIKEALSARNFLVEEWGGKYQSHDISAKKGTGVDDLLEKVLLEAELLELKANPDRRANGTIIEATLDRGRGYVCTLLVQGGTLRVGDIILAGCHYGRVKALFNERGQAIPEAGPSTPVQILGLNGAPQAGDKFNVLEEERKAKEIANKRMQLQREQGIRAQKHITLDEIGRRLAIGDFQELNVIVKGDVDGSVEALADSLLKLSTDKIQVNVIHKSVGQITETDVLLASASNAIIVGFQIRPSLNARKLAEKEEIDIRLYSVIYNAINEIKSAMEGMLAPEMKEEVVSNVEVREVFKISRVGTIAGCMVIDGKMTRNTQVRIIRDGIVIYTGKLSSLKRFKDDVKEVSSGYECGLSIENFNDIKVGDIVEGFTQVQVK